VTMSLWIGSEMPSAELRRGRADRQSRVALERPVCISTRGVLFQQMRGGRSPWCPWK
jgi:hypothetical protein